MISGAEIMVKCLEAEGVKVVSERRAHGERLRALQCERYSGRMRRDLGSGRYQPDYGYRHSLYRLDPACRDHGSGTQRPSGQRCFPGGGHHRRVRAICKAQLHRKENRGFAESIQGGLPYRLNRQKRPRAYRHSDGHTGKRDRGVRLSRKREHHRLQAEHQGSRDSGKARG